MLFPYRGVSDPSRIRTSGLMVRSHALYLLSYGTEMTLEGLAPPTLRSVGVCSESAELQGRVYRAPDLHRVLPLHRRAFYCLYQLGSSGRRESHPRHRAWEARVLLLNYVRTMRLRGIAPRCLSRGTGLQPAWTAWSRPQTHEAGDWIRTSDLNVGNVPLYY